MSNQRAENQLLSPDDEKSLAHLLISGLSCSRHCLTAGGHAPYFLNLDRVLTEPEQCTLFLEIVAKAVRKLSSSIQFDYLAFIDSSVRGPAGLLTCRAAITYLTGVPSVVIRPYKRLHASQISNRLEPATRLIFLSDVLTTGQTMARAVAICARYQLRIAKAVFVFDRQSTGKADLEAIGLRPASLLDREALVSSEEQKLSETQLSALAQDPERFHKDFLPVIAANL